MGIHKIYRMFQMRFRPLRMKAIRDMFPLLEQDGTVVDLGGTAQWWSDMRAKTTRITIVNLDERLKDEVVNAGYVFRVANACQLPYGDGSLELAFSNSVVEHVGGWYDQVCFAKEMLRCGKQVYLQTPNKWFPVEPHLITIFIHWLPFSVQRHLVRWFSILGLVNRPDQKRIDDFIHSIKTIEQV